MAGDQTRTGPAHLKSFWAAWLLLAALVLAWLAGVRDVSIGTASAIGGIAYLLGVTVGEHGKHDGRVALKEGS